MLPASPILGMQLELRLRREARELFIATKNGDIQTMEALLKSGVNPNGHPRSEFPLVGALSADPTPHFAAAQLLIAYGADVNWVNHLYAKTPLTTLVNNRNYNGILWLFEHGAYEKDGMRRSPFLPKACQDLDNRLIEIFCQHGFDVTIRRESDGATPLHILTARKNLGTSTYALQAAIQLIRAGADANAQDKHGKTPLHLLAATNHYELMNYLLHQSARTNICDEGNKIPSAYAKHPRIKRLLTSPQPPPLHVQTIAMMSTSQLKPANKIL